MTSGKIQELISVGEALFGPRWQTPLARSLGLKDASSVRQWLCGKRDLPDHTLERIRALKTRAKWVAGYGEDGREYLTHTIFPRFTARVCQEGRDQNWSMSGIVLDLGDGIELAEFVWADRVPGDGDLARLRDEAAAALEIISADDVEAVASSDS